MKKTLAMILCLVLCAALFAGCGSTAEAPAAAPAADSAADAAPAEAITLKLADNGADTMPNVIAARKFAELANEYTNGTVTVEVFSNGVLGDEASVADQLQAGTLDMARISTTGMAPSCPALRAASMLSSSLPIRQSMTRSTANSVRLCPRQSLRTPAL